jgi:cytochrome c-type biogenesis protein CcmH
MMMAFWAAVALLLAGALLFVLPPLMRRLSTTAAVAPQSPAQLAVYRAQREELDAERQRGAMTPEQHAQAIDELQRRALVEVGEGEGTATRAVRAPAHWSTIAVALAVPAGALALYGVLGEPAALSPRATAVAQAASSPHALSREQIEAMVERLAERLKTNPDDADGWHMLARSYVAFGRYPDAAQAYDRAIALVPGDPQLLSDYADTLAMVNGRSLEGRPMELVQAALKIDPAHQKSLALAGTAAFNRRAFSEAIDYWQRLQRTLLADSEQARSIEASIAQARREGAGGGATTQATMAATSTAPAPAPTPPAATGAVVAGRVSVAQALQSRIGASDTLFVFARAVNGPRMPLAIVRVSANQTWPFTFTLDDSQAMTPQMKISGHAEVMLGARLSRSGNATPQSGDLMGTLGPVKLGQRDVQLVIDTVVP